MSLADGLDPSAPFEPIYFKSLSVASLRGFGSHVQTLHLQSEDERFSPWTLILGNNGTGKSTLLQILACIGLVRRPPSNEHMIEDDGTRFSGAERLPDFDIPQFDFNAIVRGEWESPFPLRLYRVGTQNKTYSLLSFEAGSGVGSMVVRLPPSSFLFHVVGYGAWRNSGRTTIGGSSLTRACHTRHLFSDRIDLTDAEEWLLRLDYRSRNGSTPSAREAKRRFKKVSQTLTDLLPDVEGIRIVTQDDPDSAPCAMFETPSGSVRLRELGYGYQSMITWIVDLAARLYHLYPESPDPLAEPAICLIDEIDLHLHPTWQRKILSHLSKHFPKTQFIATAHSPLIVQAAEEVGANIVLLRRDGNHVVIDNDPISVKGWRVDQILSSELFDDTPSRDAETEKWMVRRVQLLQKEKLTAKEKAELKQLNEKVQNLPMASSPEDRNLDRRLKAAVELLEKAAKGTK